LEHRGQGDFEPKNKFQTLALLWFILPANHDMFGEAAPVRAQGIRQKARETLSVLLFPSSTACP
jgi:hypothetical protein